MGNGEDFMEIVPEHRGGADFIRGLRDIGVKIGDTD
jgi:hypothetical protein